MARCTYQLVEHIGGDMPARYYVNGIRVTRARFDDLRERAHVSGRLDCFHTRGRQLTHGRIRRTNYSTATFDYPTE